MRHKWLIAFSMVAVSMLSAPVGAQTTEGHLAYRVEGLDARDKGVNVQMLAQKTDQFAKLWQARYRRGCSGDKRRAFNRGSAGCA